MRFYDSPNGYRVRENVISHVDRFGDLRPAISEKLNALKIKLHKQARFAKYLSDDEATASDPTLDSVANEELFQLHTALANLPNLESWRSHIVEATSSESHTPKDPTKSSRSRDTLFELYVAGRLAASGIAVTPGEPDLRCSRDGYEFVVAVKRLKSFDKLLSRLKDAQKQIERMGMPGIIAIDMSPTRADYFDARPELSVEQSLTLSRQQLGEVFEAELQNIRARISKRLVLGVIAFTVLCRRDERGLLVISPVVNGHRFYDPPSFEADIHWLIVDGLMSSFMSVPIQAN